MAGFVTAFVGFVFLVLPPFNIWLTNLSYDLLFLFSKEVDFGNLVVIERDEKSLKQLVQTYEKWDRALFARLLDKLTADGAKLIVFDFFLSDPGPQQQDAELAEAIKKNGRVVLAVDYHPYPNNAGGEPNFPREEFMAATTNWGLSVVESSGNRISREIHPGVENLSSLAWKAASLTGAAVTKDESRRFDHRLLRFYGPPDTLPKLSFSDALIQDAGYFHDKYVFVGGKPRIQRQAEESDEFGTPYTRWGGEFYAGVVIHAVAFLNLIRGDWLTRLSPVYELLLILCSGLLLGGGLHFLRPLQGTIVGFIGIMITGAIAYVWAAYSNVWFSWMTIVSAQVPVALCWSILAHSKRLMREKEMAVNQLDREREIVDRLLPQAEPGDGTIRLPAKAPGDGQAPEVAPAEGANGKWAPPSVPDHTLVRCIGEGAYGQVWLASDIIGTFHAVKFVYRSAFVNAAPFDREFRGIQRFTPISRSHPGFVNILHVGRNEVGGYFYYIMELGDDENQGQKIVPETYSAKTLANMIRKRGKLPVGECVDLALQLTSALDFLHQHRLIHRDIKPSNIIFVNGSPKFADVGLVTDIDSKPRASTYLGTEGYIAPEGPGTPAADVFSLGKVLYEASMGKDRLQFPDLPTAVFESADPVLLKLNEIILKACELNPNARYQSAAQIRNDLAALQPK